ncbi:MAG TPA: long-chain fatty acid--CoA ligase [Solirubrobacter sp.]
MPNLAHILTRSAAVHRDRVAVQLDDVELTYGELDAATTRVAGLLRAKGVRPGDRVAIMLPNTPHFAACYYGALRAGAVVVPMHVLLKHREVAFYLQDSGAKALFAWHEFADAAHAGAEDADAEVVLVEPGQFEAMLGGCEPAADVVAREDADTAVILYTSGTTGKPKGAELTHGSLGRNVEVSSGLFGVHAGTVALGALPFFHAFGQTCALNTTIAAGGRLTLLARFDPGKALEIVERDRVTSFLGVPTMYAAMLHDRSEADTSSLAVCVSGGAAMPVEVMRAFEQRFDCQVLEGYGLSETSPVASFNRRDRERKPGSIGLPIDGVELRVADDGELLIRGHNVMRGYWNRPEATAAAIDADGWFHSGDIARVDDDGYFFIVDRKKEVVIRGGFNVYPREIEEVIYEHPAVLEAAVVGVPHETLGEEVGAAITLKPGATATPAELRAYVKQRVAAYKYPRLVWFVDELPKGPTGKILKREIKVPPPGSGKDAGAAASFASTVSAAPKRSASG